MLKFFDSSYSCKVLIELPITNDDYIMLKSLFSKNYISWSLEFGRVYSVDSNILNLLYDEIYGNNKNISIITHKNKLNRYFHKMGFKTTFKSLIKDDVLDIEKIEIVLVGGSADSSPKIIDIIKSIEFKNISLVIVQHIQIGKDYIFNDVLKEYTNNKIFYCYDGMKIEKGYIYLAPSNKHLKVVDGFFYLSDENSYNGAKPSISISYESFSNYYKNRLLVIQECGYANDGVDKLKLLKENDSKLIIQTEKECSAKSMVTKASVIKIHDYILSIKDIIIYITILNKNLTKDGWIEYLLNMVYKRYDYNFKLYYNDMLRRRIDIFMTKYNISSVKNMVAIVLFNRSVFKGFFLEISINVTELFREPATFKNFIKIIEKNYKNRHNIKIWSAGCSSGEETYSIAIILDKLGLLEKSIVYATDFNCVIVEEAKNGIYANKSFLIAQDNLDTIGFEIKLDNYFRKNSCFIEINEKIKEKTMFFQHNLIEDSSFNEFDIIICKNVIIYFERELQERVFQLFYDSLKFGGYLIIGEKETLLESFSENFLQSEYNSNIFKKVS